MKITLLADNPRTWIIPYARNWTRELRRMGHTAFLIHKQSDIRRGDILFLLGCEKKLSARKAALNRYTLVVHESDLPKGKGWSPLTWQILEGKSRIPITLFKAADEIDNGEIYKKKTMRFSGHELVDELRDVQAGFTRDLMFDFIKNIRKVKFVPQKGKSSYYPRRRPEHSRLNIKKNIKDQFNLFRVADNARYPLFFEHKGQEYIVKIEKRRGPRG